MLSDDCRYYLPISGCSGYTSHIDGLALGGQIIGLVLVGFGFALLFGRCVFVALEEAPKARRWIWYSGAIASAATALFFYQWALFGHPLAF